MKTFFFSQTTRKTTVEKSLGEYPLNCPLKIIQVNWMFWNLFFLFFWNSVKCLKCASHSVKHRFICYIFFKKNIYIYFFLQNMYELSFYLFLFFSPTSHLSVCKPKTKPVPKTNKLSLWQGNFQKKKKTWWLSYFFSCTMKKAKQKQNNQKIQQHLYKVYILKVPR